MRESADAVFFRQRHNDRCFLLHSEAVHSDYSALMNLDEPTPTHGTASTLDPLISRAEALVRQFKECFWFWHPDARVLTRDDIPMVIKICANTATSRLGGLLKSFANASKRFSKRGYRGDRRQPLGVEPFRRRHGAERASGFLKVFAGLRYFPRLGGGFSEFQRTGCNCTPRGEVRSVFLVVKNR
jgi:hypothetical protein